MVSEWQFNNPPYRLSSVAGLTAGGQKEDDDAEEDDEAGSGRHHENKIERLERASQQDDPDHNECSTQPAQTVPSACLDALLLNLGGGGTPDPDRWWWSWRRRRDSFAAGHTSENQ